MLEAPSEVSPGSLDIGKLHSIHAALRLKRRQGDLSLKEKVGLERAHLDIRAYEDEELRSNPELAKLLKTFIQQCERARSLSKILDAMRQYARVLSDENKAELLDATLGDYREMMEQMKSAQEEIEDNVRLLVERREGGRGLLVAASDLLESIQPLFFEQDNKDVDFTEGVKPIEVVSDDTLPPMERSEVLWNSMIQKYLPSVHAYDEIRARFQIGKASEADVKDAWQEKRDAFVRFQNMLAEQDGLPQHERDELSSRAVALLRPNEPIPTLEKTPTPSEGALASVSLDEVRASHEKVRAAYAAVQHTLSLEQRMHMRTQIAQLSSLVRKAELAETVAHATEHAPAVAHASLVSAPSHQPASPAPRGVFGMLRDALKLR